MNGASREKPVVAHRLVALFLLTFVGTLGLAQVPAYADPNQAVLLDGATDASSVFYVAFTDNGLQFSIVVPPDPCLGTTHVPQAGLFQGSPQVTAIFHPGDFSGRGLVVSPPLVAGALPVSLQDLWDDCDVAEHFSTVSAYLDQAYLEATNLADDIDACVQDARDAYCYLVEVIENAELHPVSPVNVSGLTLHVDDEHPSGLYGNPWLPECVEFVVILESIPQVLDSMEHALSTCEMLVWRMGTQAAGILNETILLVLEDREEYLASADECMSHAEEQSTQANEMLNEISVLQTQIDFPEVEASCEECDGSPPPDPLIPLSGAVVMQTGREPLDRYVTAFLDAANETDDPDLGLRLSDIALRLEEIPDGRVLHLTFETTSAIEQDYVALHPAGAPDDSDSPLAVLLTAVNPSPPLPPMNAADERLLFDGYEAFLLRVGGTTPGIPAVSVWGLVAMALLVLTTGTVVYARRHPPQT